MVPPVQSYYVDLVGAYIEGLRNFRLNESKLFEGSS